MGRDLEASIDLYWIPLGAGGQVVRRCGRLYEALAARLRHRAPAALYHSALEIRVPAGRYRVEQTPVPDGDGARRGVVAQGPVGLRAAGRLRLFRYEVRRWPDGAIPDGDLAVGGPRRVSTDLDAARHVLDLVPQVPTPTWGRDELGTGEMWNSNAIVAWLLERAGLDAAALAPPSGGRAPGWRAASSSRGAMLRRAGRLPPPSGNRSAARRQPLTRRRGRPPPAGRRRSPALDPCSPPHGGRRTVRPGSRRRPARRGQGSQLREEIVEAAGREIARTGDARALTLRGVAREVGVAATSIYLHFESVTELVDEVKRCRFGDPQAQLRAAADAAGDDPAARVRARARAYLRHGAEHPGDHAVLFTAKLVTDPAAARPAIGLAALEDLEVDLRAVLAARDGDDQDAGHVRAEAHLVACHLWTALHSTVMLRMLRPLMEWPEPDAQVDDLVDRLLGLHR